MRLLPLRSASVARHTPSGIEKLTGSAAGAPRCGAPKSRRASATCSSASGGNARRSIRSLAASAAVSAAAAATATATSANQRRSVSATSTLHGTVRQAMRPNRSRLVGGGRPGAAPATSRWSHSSHERSRRGGRAGLSCSLAAPGGRTISKLKWRGTGVRPCFSAIAET